jgi:hypothetical protein
VHLQRDTVAVRLGWYYTYGYGTHLSSPLVTVTVLVLVLLEVGRPGPAAAAAAAAAAADAHNSYGRDAAEGRQDVEQVSEHLLLLVLDPLRHFGQTHEVQQRHPEQARRVADLSSAVCVCVVYNILYTYMCVKMGVNTYRRQDRAIRLPGSDPLCLTQSGVILKSLLRVGGRGERANY